ncbi:MAG: PKD domain-containing protein [Solirubrobacteraceae bacterium]
MSPRRSGLLALCALACLPSFAGAAGRQVVNLPPLTLANVPFNATVDVPVRLDGHASRDADGSVQDVVWDFGDGSARAHGIEVDHAWHATGLYTVTATAVDDDGATGLPVTAVVRVKAPVAAPTDLCDDAPAGVKCQLGGGRQTAGGKSEGKVSHKGWPRVTGVLWVLDHAGRTGTGTALNDELLGGHGDDHLVGGKGNDIIWGDQWPTGNTTTQRDVIIGNGGRDWLYASHGTNSVSGGEGNDVIWSYFAVKVTVDAGPGRDKVWVKNGGGRVDCGPGRDVLHVPLAGYTYTGCEEIHHYCEFGEDGHGGCNHGPSRAVLRLRGRAGLIPR